MLTLLKVSVLKFSSRLSLVGAILVVFGFASTEDLAQTKGLIVKPASAAIAGVGRAVLGPDGDGYVSKQTNGLQRGFQANDLSESEIPYRPTVQTTLKLQKIAE